jgi:hypothetical protein
MCRELHREVKIVPVSMCKYRLTEENIHAYTRTY